ncbi:MAG: hypothetical protein H8K10_10195 [Nitrospira sp.]|nr:hypothetical protein [Nitrospira sp.]
MMMSEFRMTGDTVGQMLDRAHARSAPLTSITERNFNPGRWRIGRVSCSLPERSQSEVTSGFYKELIRKADGKV